MREAGIVAKLCQMRHDIAAVFLIEKEMKRSVQHRWSEVVTMSTQSLLIAHL